MDAKPSPPPGSQPARLLDGGWRAQALFLALTVFFCLGLLLPPVGMPAGPGMADPAQTHWNLWWIDQVVRGAAPEGSSLRHTPLLFHPLGADLSHHTLEVSYGVVTLPARWLLGANAQHAAALLLATWLTAWGTWLAARAIGAGPWGAAAATAAVTLHSYRAAEAIHLNLFGAWPLAFTIAWLARLTRDPRDRAAATGLGVTAAATLLTSHFHSLACAIAGAGWLAVMAWRWRGDGAKLRALAPRLVLALLPAAIIAAWLAWGIARAPTPPAFGPEDQARNAADVWQFLLHPRLRLALSGASDLSPGHQLRPLTWYLPGYLLAIAALLAAFRGDGDLRARWLLAGAAAFWLLGMGPWLKVGSPTEAYPGRTAIPLPGMLLAWIPGLGTVRSVWHFAFCGTLLLALAGARGADALLARLPRMDRPWLAPALLVVLVSAECFVRGVTDYPLPSPQPGEVIAARLGDSGSVAAAPQLLYEARGAFMAQQALHGRPLLGGYLSRDPKAWDRWREQRRWPLELDEILVGARAEFSPAARRHFLADRAEHDIRVLMVIDPSDDKALWSAADAWAAGLGLEGAFWNDSLWRIYSLGDKE